VPTEWLTVRKVEMMPRSRKEMNNQISKETMQRRGWLTFPFSRLYPSLYLYQCPILALFIPDKQIIYVDIEVITEVIKESIDGGIINPLAASSMEGREHA